MVDGLDFARVFPQLIPSEVDAKESIILLDTIHAEPDTCHSSKFLRHASTVLETAQARAAFEAAHIDKVRHYVANKIAPKMEEHQKNVSNKHLSQNSDRLEIHNEAAQMIALLVHSWDRVGLPNVLKQLPVSEDFVGTTRRAYSATVRALVPQHAWLVPQLADVVAAEPTGNYTDPRLGLVQLVEAGFGPEVEHVLVSGLGLKIERWIKQCAGGTAAFYGSLLEFLANQHTGTLVREAQIAEVHARADRALALVCIADLYDLTVRRYPHISDLHNSPVADLRRTMTTPELRRICVQTFQRQCAAQLLNGGVDTVDIMQAYLACLAVFAVLDPRGVLGQAVTAPIRRYLKERPDFVSELVAGLFGVPTSPLRFLAEKLQPWRPAPTLMEDSWSEWVPAPVDAPADFVRQQTEDIVGALLSLFENKEVFVRHLALLFSSKLLELGGDAAADGLADLRTKVHHLSQRFGVQHMENIEVMIQDVADSEDYMHNIHNAKPDLAPVRGLVLSNMYWPHIKGNPGGSLRLPSHVQRLVDEYASQFAELTAGQRQVAWLTDRGRVSVSLQLQDRQLDLVVLPEQATLIAAFDDVGPEGLTLGELSEITGLPERPLLNGIQFWVTHGVLGPVGEKYRVLETEADKAAVEAAGVPVVSQDPASQTQTQSQTAPTRSAHDEMQVYWSYIVGMLTNLHALPVDKIHSFLVMLVPKEDPYVKTKSELENFLLAMVDEEKLRLDEDKFMLP